MRLEELNSDLFSWSRWRRFCILDDFNIACREEVLISNRQKLRDLAIGFCDGESLICRQKKATKAVMFFYKNEHMWCHFRKKEFEAIFS